MDKRTPSLRGEVFGADTAGPAVARVGKIQLICSWLHSQTVRSVGVGFEEPHLRLIVVWFVEPEFSRISHISAYATHQGGLVLRYGLEMPVISEFEII